MKALASHQCRPGSIRGLGVIRGLSLLLLLVPAPRVFLRVLRFSSLHKNQHSQIPIRPGNSGEKGHSVDSTEIPIYLYFYLFKCSKTIRRNQGRATCVGCTQPYHPICLGADFDYSDKCGFCSAAVMNARFCW